MDEQLEINKLERDILDVEVSRMLLKYAQEILDSIAKGAETPNVDKYAKRIVAHCREQI